MIQKPRGTNDLIGESAKEFEYVINSMISVVKKYNYLPIITPIFEDKSLFIRSIGEDTDIVSKEMYSFQDLGNRSFALRPEGTAPVVRAVLENKLYTNVLKYYYFGPMFRYERPQKGRQRQFYQFGIEQMNTSGPYADAEVIMLALDILKNLKIKNYSLKINTIGKKQERNDYIKILKKYFESKKEHLCSDCQARLQKNAFRIFDCKNDYKKEIITSAPNLQDYLSEESKQYFQKILFILQENNISYEISNELVRGLDYYEDTIFEIVSNNSDMGGQSTIIGGGRYNGLSKELGGPEIPSIGFGIGIERLIECIKLENTSLTPDTKIDFYLILLDEKTENYATKIIVNLRNSNLIGDRSYGIYNFKSQAIKANNLKANYLIVIGNKEMDDSKITLQNNKTSKKELFDLKDLQQVVNIIKQGS